LGKSTPITRERKGKKKEGGKAKSLGSANQKQLIGGEGRATRRGGRKGNQEGYGPYTRGKSSSTRKHKEKRTHHAPHVTCNVEDGRGKTRSRGGTNEALRPGEDKRKKTSEDLRPQLGSSSCRKREKGVWGKLGRGG